MLGACRVGQTPRVSRTTCVPWRLQNEKTALHLAVERGHEDIVDKLLALKADVKKKDSVGA